MTGWHAVLLLTSLLYLGCGSGRPTTQASPPAVPPATVPPEPAAADEPPAREPQSQGPEACAEVEIGLDLQALPQPASDADIQMYTLGQADDFRQAFPTTTRVEIYVQDGVAAFTAKLYSASEPDLLALCASIAEKFIAGVPGHPLAIGEPGGSIIEPCAWCHEESDNASPDLESTIPEPECLASFAAPACADATECLARGRQALAATQSCGWSTLCMADDQCKLAFVSFLFACRAKNARGCYELAEMHPHDMSELSGQPPDPAAMRRVALHEKGCELGYGRSCYRLGEDHHGTPEGNAWYKKSVPLYEKACADGDAEQCSLLAYNYNEERGVARNRKKAVKLFARACELGDGYGCENHGRALYEGKVIPRDRKRARSRFKRACELDPPYNGCYLLGQSYLLGTGGRASTKEAVKWFHEACPDDGGIHHDCNACRRLQILCAKGYQPACGPSAEKCR